MHESQKQLIHLDLFGQARLEFVPLCLGGSGELTVIEGRNGIGKTSLLRALAGVLECESVIPIRALLKTSYCGAAPRGMLYHLSGRDNLKLFLRYQRQQNFEEIETVFDHPTYIDALETTFKDCSSGMKKLLLLAHSFLLNANLYLLDEPFTHLDQKACLEIDRQIDQLLKTSSIVVVDHSRRLHSHPSVKIIDLDQFHKSGLRC